MKFDFTSPDPEKEVREELLQHLEAVQPTMKPGEYLTYRRVKLDQFNAIIQHVYKYQKGLIANQRGDHAL